MSKEKSDNVTLVTDYEAAVKEIMRRYQEVDEFMNLSTGHSINKKGMNVLFIENVLKRHTRKVPVQ